MALQGYEGCFCLKRERCAGSDEHPILSLLEIAFLGKGAHVTADDPAAVEAYHRASDLAMQVAAGVKLEEGDVLCIHNGRSVL